MKWLKDPKVESHLKQMNIEFEVKVVKIADIDLQQSLDRQTRMGKKINDDWVLEYATAMQTGSQFPMTILNQLGKSIWIWSGLHRVHSAELIGETEIEAYLLHVHDPRIQDMLPRVVNTWEGRRPPREELLINAQYLIENYGLETKEAGRLLSLKPEWIVFHMRGGKVLQEIEASGASANGISRSLAIRLAPIAENRNVLRETVKLLKKHDVGFEQAKQIANQVKEGRTEQEQLAEVKKWDASLSTTKEAKPKPFRTERRTRFLSLLSGLRNMLVDMERASELQLSPEDGPKVAEYWNIVNTKLSSFLRDGKGGRS